MKKWIFIALIGAGIYMAHKNGLSFFKKDGAFDKNGNPIVRVFVGPNCGQPCDEVETLLAERNVPYEEIDISTPEGESFGIRRYPLTMIGGRSVVGNANDQIVSALAETFGPQVFKSRESAVMKGHFDEYGKPLVVMYGTSWCEYCKEARSYLNDKKVQFVDVDIEASVEGKTAFDILHGNGTPLIYVGYRRINGFNEDELKGAIADLVK